MHAATSLSMVSLLSFGYLSMEWTKPNKVEEHTQNDSSFSFEPKQPPHIIFILTDDQGFNDIGYHNPDIRTPTLDKLASEGVKLENYYVQPICTPSRSQLITGRYQIHTGLQHSIIWPRQPNCLPLDMTTLPQRLQEAGYTTHMVGKWHLGFYRKECLPTRRGFHSYFGSLTGSVDYYTFGSCDGPGLCGYDLHEGETVAWGRGGKFSTHLYTQRVLKILSTHDPSRQPLFMFLSLQAVHTPLQSPKAYIYPYRGMGNVARRKYQIHTGLQHSIIRPRQPNCLPLDMTTLPQRLQEAGYATHMVGKWHLGFYRKECLPTRRGFHSYFGSLTGSVDYYTFGSCDGPGLCGYDLHEGETVAWGRGGKFSTHLYTQRVRKILSTHDPSRQPLFMFLSLQAVHTPLQSPKAYIYPYRGMGNVARRKYAAMVSIVDEAVRNVTYALRKYDYYRNSVLIFSTDNGAQPFTGGSNWPLRGRKGTYWEGGVRGVGFVHSPLLRNKRRVSKALMHITDWYPTLVGLAGGNVSLTERLDGYDVWPTISEGKESPRLEILHNIDPLHRRSGLPPSGSGQEAQHLWDTTVQAAIRVGDWKLLTGDPGHGDWVPPQVLANFPGSWWTLERNTGGTGKSVWLFNITVDPYERSDLALQRPDVVKQLLARLAYYNRTAVPVRFPTDDPRANPDRNGGAWVPWVGGDEDEQKWNGVYKKGRNKRKKKRKLGKLRSFFKKLNTRIMFNRI